MTRTSSAAARAAGRLALALLLAVGGLLTGLDGAPAPAAAQGDCTVAADTLALDADEAQLLRLVNAHRAANNVQPALLQSETLRKVATYLSADNAGRRVSSLVDGLRRGLLQRFPDCGYTGFAVISAFAEHVCCDDGSAITPDAAFGFWKGSPIPNQNMLDPRYRYVGVARECPVDDRCYWTLTLGTEPSGATEAVPPGPPGAPGRGAPAQVPPAPAPISRAGATIRTGTTDEATTTPRSLPRYHGVGDPAQADWMWEERA